MHNVPGGTGGVAKPRLTVDSVASLYTQGLSFVEIVDFYHAALPSYPLSLLVGQIGSMFSRHGVDQSQVFQVTPDTIDEDIDLGDSEVDYDYDINVNPNALGSMPAGNRFSYWSTVDLTGDGDFRTVNIKSPIRLSSQEVERQSLILAAFWIEDEYERFLSGVDPDEARKGLSYVRLERVDAIF